MHYFDIIIAAVALIFFITGFKRGLIGELVRLIGVVIAFIVAISLYTQVYALLVQRLPFSRAAVTAISFIGLFFAALLVVLAAGWLLRRVVQATLFGGLDRILGGIVGVCKVVVIVWVFVMSVEASPFQRTRTSLAASYVYSLLKDIGPDIHVPSIALPRQTVGNALDSLPRKIRARVNAMSSDSVIIHEQGTTP
jgi:uncharacterized membrane protein required for colicin V production